MEVNASRPVAAKCKRILIDVSNIVQSDLHTGIQRVVHNITKQAIELEDELGVRCVPISIHGKSFFNALHFFGPKRIDDVFFGLVKTSLKFSTETTFWLTDRISPSLTGMVDRVGRRIRKLFYPRAIVRKITAAYLRLSGRKIVPNKHDVLLLLDASWNIPIEEAITEAHQNGADSVSVVYDLIPILHPQFHDQNLRTRFEGWLRLVLKNANHFFAISETVRDALREFAEQNQKQIGISSSRKRQQTFESFRLGADFNSKVENSKVDPDIKSLFNVKTPVILSVGTVEPRKNHAMLLNAMERVWSEGNEARLVIAGRPGWMCDDLHDRLRNHAENQTRLYWFDDASDADIGYLYQNARLFAFPSVVEGFGLPIVESLFHGTPVVASDTQIHREVGRDRCEYFSLDDVEALKRLIVTASQTPKPSIAGEIEICSWRESARELLSKVILQKQAAKPAHQVDKMIDSFASKAA